MRATNFLFGTTQCHTRRRVSCDAARCATDPCAAQQVNGMRIGQSSSSADCYEKERPNEPLYELMSSPLE